jgi:hypothetical protein
MKINSKIGTQATKCIVAKQILFGHLAGAGQQSLERWRGRELAVILVLNQYKCIGCSPGKHPDTRTMATGSDDDNRDSAHDRCLCIAV